MQVRIAEIWTSKKRLGIVDFNPLTVFHLRDVSVVIDENPALSAAGASHQRAPSSGSAPEAAVAGDWPFWLARSALANSNGLPVEFRLSNFEMTVGDWALRAFRFHCDSVLLANGQVMFHGEVRLETTDRVWRGRRARLAANGSTLVFDSGQQFELPFSLEDLAGVFN